MNRKEVLAEFHRLQERLSEIVNGFVSVSTYCMGGEFWDVSLTVTEYEGNIIVRKDSVRWVHFTEHSDEFEADNEKELKDFKFRFNLK